MSKDYIYTGTNKFDEKNIIIENGDKKIDTKKNTITISNQKLGILKTYNIVTINKIPDHSAGYIYTDTNLLNVNDRDIVNVANATANIIDNNLVILKDNDELLRIPIISITSKIDLGKGYIYGLTDDNISSNVKVSNGKVEIAETKDTKKLIVKDPSGKILKEVNIPKITFNKNIDVKGKVIMIKEKIDYKDFIKNVSCKSCQIEIKNNKETISNGIIEHQMKLNVMYNSTILDAYTFSVDYLEMNSISYDEKYIYGFRHGSKMGDLISNISTSGKIKVTTPEGKELTSNDSLATGEKVTITLNDGNVINYIVVVKGDVLGHATVSVGDVGTLFLHLRKINNVEECYEKAGDVLNPGNGITIGDVSTIFLYIRGIINNLEE
ncbi:MAG TPA: hypothetical protein DCE23_00310 [Firmicutes bacterium]|nr:hypothetical protein [Bacillota bacterium]